MVLVVEMGMGTALVREIEMKNDCHVQWSIEPSHAPLSIVPQSNLRIDLHGKSDPVY